MLTPRLLCIYNHSRARTVADIGTDHAYIPIELAKNNRVDRAAACDINAGPCAIARSNIEKEHLEKIIQVRMGGGLSVIGEGEFEEIIIAGMGGKLICSIIDEDIKTARASRLILQPMNCQNELRKYLTENGFKITSEDIEIEGFKVYNIFTAESGSDESCRSEIDYHVPRALYSHMYIDKLIHKKQREFEKILNGLERSAAVDDERASRYRFLLSELERIKCKIKEGN